MIGRLQNLVRRNLAAKILCFLVALVLWGYVMNDQNPSIEGTFSVPLTIMNAPEGYKVSQETGAVKLGGVCANEVAYWHFSDDPADSKTGLGEQTVSVYGNGHTALFADMAQAIITGRQPYVDAAAGRRAVETVLAIYLSSKTGRPVSLPLHDIAGTDFTGLFGGEENV